MAQQLFFFAGKPPVAQLNDNNTKLINFYNSLRNEPEALWDVYSSIPICEKQYYITRDIFNSEANSVNSAARFLFLNHYSFNGIYRTNRSGDFNTPFGAKVKIKQRMPLESLLEASRCIQGATFHSQDFELFLRQVNPSGALIYMDPPYFTSSTRVFTEYGASTFSRCDLSRLANCAKDLATRNKVVISYKKCPEFDEYFHDFIVGEIAVTRNVGGFAGRRKSDAEYIAVMGGI